MQLHQETVDLREGKRVHTFHLHGILRGDDEEERIHRVGGIADRHLAFCHHFQEGRLHFWRRAVDLVGQEDVRKDRAGRENEAAGARVEDVDARDVVGQEVGRELDPAEDHRVALPGTRNELCDGLGEGRLPEARHVLDQHVTAGEDAGHQVLENELFSPDDGRQPVHQAPREEMGALQIQGRGVRRTRSTPIADSRVSHESECTPFTGGRDSAGGERSSASA